jgi:hypothetical protein
MDANHLVQPNVAAPAAPEVTPTEPEAPVETKPGTIPDTLLKIPAFQALMVGKPGAISDSIKDFSKRGEAEALVKHADVLKQAGFGFYRSLDGNTGVVFNRQYVHDDELKQADVAGQLRQVAPDFDSINHAVSKSGIFHPALDSSHVAPTSFKQAPMPSVPQMAQSPIPPAPASVQTQANTARLRNLQPGSPTSGPVPGAGRLLNSVLKPVL